MTSERLTSTILLWVFAGAALVGVAAVGFIYGSHFTSLSSDHKVWGEFGSFFGGVVTPILAFFSFITLLYTVHIQHKELSLTRQELELSRLHQQRSADAIERQNTDNMFFSIAQQITNKQRDIADVIDSFFHDEFSAGKFERGDFGKDNESSRQDFLKLMCQVQKDDLDKTITYCRWIIALVAIMTKDGALVNSKYRVLVLSLIPPKHLLYVTLYYFASDKDAELLKVLFTEKVAPTESELDSIAERTLIRQIRKNVLS